MSHPVWVRGLKHDLTRSNITMFDVAPRVGAWIETEVGRKWVNSERVAPRVGAWIETWDVDSY